MVGSMRILHHGQTHGRTDRRSDGAGFIGPAGRQGISKKINCNLFVKMLQMTGNIEKASFLTNGDLISVPNPYFQALDVAQVYTPSAVGLRPNKSAGLP